MEVIADGWFHMTNTDDPPGVTKSLKARTFSGISAVFSGTHKAVPVFLLYFTIAFPAPVLDSGIPKDLRWNVR